MKLVEILARELKEWPENDCTIITQDHDRNIYFWKRAGVFFDGREWSHPTGGLCQRDWYLKKRTKHLASDYATAIVTRADWEAERARIAKPAKNSNKDGWIRHRGGKCPVELGSVIDVRYRDGKVIEKHFATENPSGEASTNAIWQHRGNSHDIMAYRLHKPAEQPAIEPAVVANVQAFNERAELRYDPCASGPLQWRDRITEIDATVEALEEERASLVQRLESEGFRLIQRVVQPVEDMSDPKNWKRGDILYCTCSDPSGEQFVEGSLYVFKSYEEGSSVRVEQDSEGSPNGMMPFAFKFHSRPSK